MRAREVIAVLFTAGILLLAACTYDTARVRTHLAWRALRGATIIADLRVVDGTVEVTAGPNGSVIQNVHVDQAGISTLLERNQLAEQVVPELAASQAWNAGARLPSGIGFRITGPGSR